MRLRFVTAAVIFGVLAAAGWWYWSRSAPEHRAARSSRELATRLLAQHLAGAGHFKKALVIANPFSRIGKLPKDMQAMEDAGVEGLRVGFGAKISMVMVFPELRPGVAENPRSAYIAPGTTTPLSYLVAPDAFDRLVQAHPDCDLVVSLIGLPAELSRVQCWERETPGFALLLPDLRIIGDRAALQRCLRRGKLVGFVMARPGAVQSLSGSAEDWQALAKERFVLVTPENFAANLQSWPQLVPSE